MVPPDTLNPFSNAVGVMPFMVLFVSVSVPLNVATFNPFTNKFESIVTFPFANNESVIVVLPLTYKEESILAFNLSAFKLIAAVLEAIKVGIVAIVDEDTPPTLLIVVVKVPVPLPLTSPVKAIN